MIPAIYNHGEPQNLEAAALDALDWLRLLQRYIVQVRGQPTTGNRLQDDRKRIEAAIAALETFLPNTPPIHRDKQEGWPFEYIETEQAKPIK